MASCLCSIFPYSISTSSFRHCSYYRMYFYSELTISSNLCHYVQFSAILRSLQVPVNSSYATTPCASNRWLLSPRVLAVEHEIALPCIGLSIDCAKHVAIELYTWTSIRQSFFANNPGNAVLPNFFTAKVSYYTEIYLITRQIKACRS